MKLKTLKNKYILTYPLLALGFVLGSCSQEEGDNTLPEIDSQRKTITFTANPVTAETKDISTRVSLNTGSSNGNDGLDWVNNDKVSFYFIGENNNNVKKTFTVSVGGTTTITGETPTAEGDYTIFAISPYKSAYFPVYGSTTLTIPATLTQDPDPANLTHNHLSDYIYMYAHPSNIISIDGDETATGGDIALDFNLLISLLRFEIVNNSSSDIKLHSVSISYPDESAKLYSTLELDEDNYTFSPTNANHEKMTLNFSDIALASGDGRGGYLPIFPTTSVASIYADLEFIKNNKSYTILYELKNVSALQAGNRYSVLLDVQDTDNNQKLGEGKDVINDNEVITYTYHNGSKYVTWMVSPLRSANGEFVIQTPPFDCPPNYYYPSGAEVQDLYQHMMSNNFALELFLANRAPMNDIPNNEGNPFIIIGGPLAYYNTGHASIPGHSVHAIYPTWYIEPIMLGFRTDWWWYQSNPIRTVVRCIHQ
jgi:hypothetical protein